MIGEVLGSYRIISQLGQGGMGAVFLAEHQLIGRRAAIKVLHPEFSQAPRFAARFINEARVLTLLRHPGLVAILDYGVRADGMAYLVMEYLAGSPLHTWLQRERGTQATLILFKQIAEATAVAHSAQVVHRDLKPANVIVIPDTHAEGGARAVVVDFGIARLVGGEQRSGGGGTVGIVGSPCYMAPEQCRGQSAIDEKADVYALGIMLYEALTGRCPFQASETVELLMMHVSASPVAPRHITPTISPALEQLVLGALAKDPASRPTMTELASQIKRLLSELPALSARAAAPPRTHAAMTGLAQLRRALWTSLREYLGTIVVVSHGLYFLGVIGHTEYSSCYPIYAGAAVWWVLWLGLNLQRFDSLRLKPRLFSVLTPIGTAMIASLCLALLRVLRPIVGSWAAYYLVPVPMLSGASVFAALLTHVALAAVVVANIRFREQRSPQDRPPHP